MCIIDTIIVFSDNSEGLLTLFGTDRWIWSKPLNIWYLNPHLYILYTVRFKSLWTGNIYFTYIKDIQIQILFSRTVDLTKKQFLNKESNWENKWHLTFYFKKKNCFSFHFYGNSVHLLLILKLFAPKSKNHKLFMQFILLSKELLLVKFLGTQCILLWYFLHYQINFISIEKVS